MRDYIMKSKVLVAYYLVLVIILISWNNPDALPPLPLRFAFCTLVLFPIVARIRDLFVAILFFFVILSTSSHAVSYMPATGQFLLMIVFVGAVFLKPQSFRKVPIPISVILLLFLVTLTDIITSYSIKETSFILLVLVIVLSFLIKQDSNQQLAAMSFSFVILSFVLAIEYLIWGQQFAYTITVGNQDFERIGWADPNYFSCIIGIGLLISFYNLLSRYTSLGRVERLLYITTCLLSFFVVILSASRGATISILGGILSILLLSRIKMGRKIVATLVCVFLLILAIEGGFLDLLYNRFGEDDGTGGSRTLIWAAKFDAFRSSDFFHQLLGFGLDKGRSLGYQHVQGFHNDYLAFLVCYGLVGAFLFIISLFYPLFIMRQPKSIIIPSVVYLALVCVSLEPFSSGLLVFYYFYLYILILSEKDNS